MARRRSRRPQTAPAAPRPKTPSLPPNRTTVIIFAVLALYLGGTAFRLVMQELTLVKQGQILQAEKAAVMAQHDELTAQIAQAKTNAGIERLAREQLGLVMPQEIPVKTAAAPPPAPVQADVEPAGGKKPAVGLPPAMAAVAKFFTP